MSFFDDASLVLISDFAAASASMVSGSGANTGKAYSIKPIDGSGDFTFERGSDITATRVNSSGYIEKGRGNFLLQSNNFDTTPWNDGGEYTIESGQDGYDSTTDAWLLQKNTTGNDYLSQSSLSTDAVNTISFYAKEGSVRGVKVVCGGQNVNIDLRDGSTISTGGASNLIAAGADLVIGTTDWYRVYLTRALTTIAVLIKPTDENGADSIGSIYIQDTQLERGLVATDYIETTTAPLRAGLLEDEPRFDYHNSASPSPNTCPSLLLEPSRTNEIVQSEYFDSWTKVLSPTITNNYGISPEGVQNSTRFEATSDRITTSITTINANETFSIYMKGSGTLRIQIGDDNFYPTVTSEWVRYEFTTTQAGVLSNIQIRGNGSAVDVELYGAQYERNSYPTSYIPTYGVSDTRTGDNCFLNNTSILEQTSATYFLETTPEEITSNNFIDARGASSANNRILWQTNSGGALRILVRAQGSSILDQNISSAVANDTKVKIALKYTPTNITVYVDGVKKIDTDISVDFSPEINGIDLEGSVTSNDNPLRHHQFLFFPEALSDDDCATLTTL